MTLLPLPDPRPVRRRGAGPARFALLGALLLAGACDHLGGKQIVEPPSPEAGGYVLAQQAGGCGLALSTVLRTEDGADVGFFTVWNDEANLYVRFRTTPGWLLHHTYLAAATRMSDIPLDGTGNPIPGYFALQQAHPAHPSEYVYTIPRLAEWATGTSPLIAGRAEVRSSDGKRGAVTWAIGRRFVEPHGVAMYIPDFTLQDCTGQAIVVGDANVFDDVAMANPGNQQWVRNLIGLPAPGPRGEGRTVWFDRGRGAACAMQTNLFGQPNYEPCNDERLSRLRSVIEQAGYRIESRAFATGGMTSIPRDVKLLFLWTPRSEHAFTADEVNQLRRFVAEGGRIVYISEWQMYYGDLGVVATATLFLQNMGSAARVVGAGTANQPLHDCASYVFENPRQPAWPPKSIAYAVTSRLGSHGSMAGVADIALACASTVRNVEDDAEVLFRDRSGAHVLGASVRVSTKAVAQLPVPVGASFSAQAPPGIADGPASLFVGSAVVPVQP
jgi:hypothetical protein